MRSLRPIDITYGAVFVCLMTVGANITVWFPILAIPIGGTSVPLSLQTFFAILAGMMLGKKIGPIAMITYTFIGTAGVPVFAGLQGGPFALISPTGGFILSFIFVAFFAGSITELAKSPTISVYTVAAIVGLLVNYVIGVTYMYIAMNTWLELEIAYKLAWAGMIPFLIKDTALSILGAVFMVNVSKRLPAKWQRAA
ncbi:biotin transporter BioY [Oceanobacillus halophilus]|uniref:Biotin transporter n=1 Tax=Oceanobacillus halophilus TaxID=930130 RepID=A0A494ZTQ9_9BACI|nr:biotin transporter BioY [Oceanobacillus halophilus]RKQ29587.1 biotin transporter BioY [Oceanobacillus halophilus]